MMFRSYDTAMRTHVLEIRVTSASSDSTANPSYVNDWTLADTKRLFTRPLPSPTDKQKWLRRKDEERRRLWRRQKYQRDYTAKADWKRRKKAATTRDKLRSTDRCMAQAGPIGRGRETSSQK